MEKYPIYKVRINEDDDTAMYAVSLVDEPAVERDFLAFSDEKTVLSFAIENEEKHIVTGLVMCADTPIIRVGKDRKPYYIVFDKETIKIMARKFLRCGFNQNVDLNHDFNYIEGVELLELYIKDSERGISPKGFEDVAEGSLFGTYFIKNEEVWNEIKNGTYKGFSIEIVCEEELAVEDDDKELAEVEDLVNKLIKRIRSKNIK